MKSFQTWLEDSQTMPPSGTEPEKEYGPSQSGHSNPNVAWALERLKSIHNELRNIASWTAQHVPSKEFQDSFRQEMIAAIDGVGRARTILLPDDSRIPQESPAPAIPMGQAVTQNFRRQ